MQNDDSGPREAAAGRSLSRRLREVLEIDPEAPAVTFEGVTYPWQFYGDALTALEVTLARHPGADRIGIVLRNRPGSMAAIIATIATGRQVVTLSPHLGDAGLAQDILELSPDVIIADRDDWERGAFRDAAEQSGAIAMISACGPALVEVAGGEPHPARLPANGVAILMMTSGTTGRPKRVELGYDRLTASYRSAGVGIDGEDEARLRPGTIILWASLAHISGLYFAISHVLEGRTAALLEKFEVDAWVELVRAHRPRLVRLAPTALRMVLRADVPPDTFESVVAVGSGTAPLPPELAEEFEARFDVPVLGTYGATEFAGAIAGWSLKAKRKWGASKRGSVGRAFPGIELRTVDPNTGEPLAAGSTGLLEARGPQLPGGEGEWLRTTDLAVVDEDGFLFIRGRADGAINRGGFKIPPSVIEDALCAHPAVDEASAIGLPHDRLGEVPAAVVTLSSPATESELMSFLTDRLTRYQRPVALKVVEHLPRTPSMKVSRALVMEQFFSSTDESLA
ncbi:MAG: class I adenylate-forming enzyme family protein [Nocardioides sp.]|uniref:class I adenylate-forming enzyme family protein n=1 Tax=Nocardioides sp. TaxID=35761 RepID=UPI0039E49FB7